MPTMRIGFNGEMEMVKYKYKETILPETI